MVKIGVLSDTHLVSVTKELRNFLGETLGPVDALIHAGDMTGLEVHDYLSAWELWAVRGNMDDLALQHLLPEKRVIEIEGVRIGVIHGRGAPDVLEEVVVREFKDVDLIVFGHSHIPFMGKRGNMTLFNPGSFRPTYSARGSAGLIEIGPENELLRGAITLRHLHAT
jgi:uncharacterized protein